MLGFFATAAAVQFFLSGVLLQSVAQARLASQGSLTCMSFTHLP